MLLEMLKDEQVGSALPTLSEPDIEYSRMEAGYNALFEQDSETSTDTYFKVLAEQDDLGYSPTSVGLKDALHREETDSINIGINSAVLDPSLDMNTRVSISHMEVTDDRKETSLPTKLGGELLMQEDELDGLPETPSQSSNRDFVIGAWSKITEYREAQQSWADMAASKNDVSILSVTADIIQLTIPFIEQSNVAEALFKVGEGKTSLAAFLMDGNAKKSFFDAFRKMSPEQRLEAAPLFLQVAHEANKTGWVTNGLLEKQMTDELIYGGTYSDAERWVDNLAGWLDLTIIGKPAATLLKGSIKGAKAGRGVSKAVATIPDAWTKEAVRTSVSPVSPIRIASETNTEKAKVIFRLVAEDTTEEAANAMGASSRADVIGDAVLHEMHKGAGVRNKVHNIEAAQEKAVLLNKGVREALDESNINASTRKEMDSAEANVAVRLQEAVGVTSRKEMFQHEHTPTGAVFHGVYGPERGGWTDPEEAFSLTEIALREHGLSRKDMYLLEKSETTGEYVRVAEATGKDFLVGIEYNYRLNLSDITEGSSLFPEWNFLDRLPLAAKFSLNRHLFDPATIHDPHLFLGANAAVDKSARITKDFLNIGQKYVEIMSKRSQYSQDRVMNYLKEANEKQIPHNMNTLYSEYGFGGKEIEAISSFRDFWDNVWQARNIADVRALRNRGFGLYQNAKLQDKYVARPVDKGHVDVNERIYDPMTGLATHYTRDAVHKLYDEGTRVAKLRKPQDLGGAVLDQIVIRNDASWRGLNESDNIYPYREGYFQRIYTQPHFVIETLETEGGRKFDRAIATTETVTDANLYIKRLQKENPDATYYSRGDSKDPREQANFEQDTFEASGMSNQMSRGAKLVDGTAVVRGTEDSNVLGPVDSIIDASRSMGKRVGMGEFIAASKDRFMRQYGHLAPRVNGMPKYPTEMSDIAGKGATTGKEVADARSTYEYISSLEFGYINGMDSIFKGVLKGIGEIAGERGFRAGEMLFAKAGAINPTSLAKNFAFQAYIAANPFRQLALNSNQATILTAVFPKYILSQRLAADMHVFMYKGMGFDVPKAALKLAGRSKAETELMWTQFQKSGLTAAIDQNSMLRGALADMVEANKYKGESSILLKPLHKSREYGFDLGERIVLTSSWLAHYDKAFKDASGVLDASDYGRIAGKARNFTLNMNRAGEMPYNSNSLSLLFMYMQIPHKALLQLSNRAFTAAEKVQLGLFESIMYTLPVPAMYTIFGPLLPDQEKSPEAHQAIVEGLQFYTWNKMLSLASGGDLSKVSMDFGSMAPADVFGIYTFFRDMAGGEFGDMLSNTPAGQLFAGGNPKVTNLVKTLAKATFPDGQGTDTPVKASRIMHDIAAISSGMSSIFRAGMALKYGKIYSSSGVVTDPSVSTPEAMLVAFGLYTMSHAQNTWVGMEAYKKTKEYKDDINEWYKTYVRDLNSDGITADEQARVILVQSQAWHVFGSSKVAQDIIKRNLDRDMKRGDKNFIFNALMKQAGALSKEEVLSMSNALPVDEANPKRHENLIETYQVIEDFNNKEEQ